MKIKQVIRKGLELTFSTFGVEAKFFKKSDKVENVIFDQNQIAHYYHPNKRMELYYEGLDRAEVRWSDNYGMELVEFSPKGVPLRVLS